MKRNCPIKSILAAVVFCVLASGQTTLAITAAQNLEGELEISPSAPTASWPESDQSNDLAPNYTATISVTVVESEEVDGVNYTLSSGPDATTGSSDSNVVWTESGTTFSITNTAKDTASASMTLTCIWSPERGEGEGGEGTGPKDIPGRADADVHLLDSVVQWNFDRTLQWADGEKSLGFTVTVTDDNGYGLENWSLNAFKTTEANPSDASWGFFPVASNGPAWIVSSTIVSPTPSKGKVKIEYNDGSDEQRKSLEEVAFFLVEFISPANEPEENPKLSGEGKNVFLITPESDDVGFQIKAKVNPASVASRVVADSSFTADDVQGVSKEWGQGNENGKPTASGEFLTASISYPNITVENQDLGLKEIQFVYDNEDCVSTGFFLLAVEIGFTHILGKVSPLVPTIFLAHDEYGQPANGQWGHSDWGAASFSQTSWSKAQAMIKRWNYEDTIIAGDNGSCNSIAESSPPGYGGAGGIQIDVNWQPVGNIKPKITFGLKAVYTNNHSIQPGNVLLMDRKQKRQIVTHGSGMGELNTESELILDAPPYRLSYEPTIGISGTGSDAEVQIDLEIEVMSIELVY